MEINFDQIVLQALNFGVLLLVLTKFLYRPVLKMLQERQAHIDAGINAADKNIKEQAKISAASQKVLTQAHLQAAEIIAQAKKEAQATASQIISQAKEDLAKMQTKERAQLQAQLADEEKRFHTHLNGLVVSVSKKVLAQSLSQTDQTKIIDSEIKHLNQMLPVTK
jgi:F-type H+-transporting ATPase subunit b